MSSGDLQDGIRDANDHDLDEPSPEPEVNQLRLYLLASEIVDPLDALRDPDRVRRLDLRRDLGFEGDLFIASPFGRQPSWLEFVRALTHETIDWGPASRLSAVLFVRRPEGQFALTFGFGSLLLRSEAIEADYGLKVAAGLIDPQQLASVDARSLDTIAVQVRRQSSSGLEPQTLGFDSSREMLRAIAGRVLDEQFGTRVVGSNSLSVNIPMRPEAVASTLDRLHAAYVEGRYRTRFGHIDRWRSVPRGATHDALDAQLAAVLRVARDRILADEAPFGLPGDQRAPILEAPEIISYRGAGFRTSREARDVRHPFPDLGSYLGAVPRPPTVSDLARNHELDLLSDETGDVIRRWSIYGALYWEVEHEGGVYVLAEGRWWQVDPGYRDQIDEYLRTVPEADLPRPPKDEIEWEVDYNERLAAFREGRGFLDRRTARFEGEAETVEPCDVLTPERQFVHVKPETSAAALSHLFAQAYVSARLFQGSSEFRTALRALLAGQGSIIDVVPTGRPDPREYEVVFGIVTSATPPIGPTLPFFSRSNLARVIPDIEAMGYRVSLAQIDERANVRPADAGPLFRQRTALTAADVEARSPARSRRRGRAATPVTDVVDPTAG